MSDFSTMSIGGFIDLPSNIYEAITLPDCLAIKCHGSHWLILPFRDGFVKCRITKKKYSEIVKK